MLPGIAGIAGMGRSAISFVNIATASSNTVALPTHQTGDLILILAQGGSSTPSTPAGYSSIKSGNSSGDSAWSWNAGYKIAASASETSGTWTNSSIIAAAVYRGVSGIGASNESISSGTTATWNALTLSGVNGSWVVGLLAHEFNVSATGVPFTTRDNVNKRTWFDTAGPVFSFSSVNASLANGSRGWTTISIELVN